MTPLGGHSLLVTVLVAGLVVSGAAGGGRPSQPGSPPIQGGNIAATPKTTSSAPARALSSPPATAAGPPSSACTDARTISQFFSAGDVDPKVLGGPTGGRGGVLLRRVGATGDAANATFLTQLGTAVDVAVLSTRPETRLTTSRQSVTAARLTLLACVNRNSSTSLRPSWAPPPEDSRSIKDAVIAYIGVTGATARLNGTALDGTLVLPQGGTVLEFVDYRVDLPPSTTNRSFNRQSKTVTVIANASDSNESVTETEPVSFHTPDGETLTTTISVTAPANETRTKTETITARVDGQRTHTTHRVENRSARRRLELGAKNWTKTTTPGTAPYTARQIGYGNASAGPTRLRLRANITMWANATTKTYDWVPTGLDSGYWTRTDTSFRLSRDRQTVSTSRRGVRVTTHDWPLPRVYMRSITGEGRTAIVLQFTGPPGLTRHRLWSRIRLSNHQLVMNGWGVYARQRQPGDARRYSAANPHGKPVGFPPTLRLKFTAISPSPTLQVIGDPTASELASVSTRGVSAVGRGPADLPAHVNLSTARPRVPAFVIIRDAPTTGATVYDIHGAPIRPDRIVRAEFHDTVIETTRLNATAVKLRLVDTATGGGIGGRTLTLKGARQAQVTTSNAGGNVGGALVRVPPSTAVLRVSFAGTPLTASTSIFYLESATTLPMAGPYNMVQTVTALFTTGLPFYVIAALLLVVYLVVREPADSE